jgi:hypothetical protein
MEGWIKLHRKITEWDWYDDANTFRLFIHLLLLANSKDANWRGINIKRGELITSVAHLSEDLKLTSKQIRLSLEKLKKTSEIDTQRANNATMITIYKYDSYQAYDKVEGQTKGQPKDKPRANEGQTEGNKQEGEERKEHKNNTWRTNFNIYADELNNAVKVILDDAKWIAEQEALNPNVDIIATIKKSAAVYWGVEAEGYANKKKSRGNDLNWKSTFAKNMNKNIVWKSRGYNKPVSDIPFNENSFVKNSGLSQKSTEFKEF